MAELVRTQSAKPIDLSLITETHVIEGENLVLQVVLRLYVVHLCLQPPHKSVNKSNINLKIFS